MAVSSGFFNHQDDDRLYNANEVCSIFDGIILDGVFKNYLDGLAVTLDRTAEDGQFKVNVGAGRCWFDHTWMYNDSTLSVDLKLTDTDKSTAKIHAIIIDVDGTDDVRDVTITVVKGTAAGKYPTLINEGYHHQYPLAYIEAPANITKITANMIKDRRGLSTIDMGTTAGKCYGCPWAVLVEGSCGLDTNMNVTIAGFQFDTAEVKKEDMRPNLLYAIVEKI